MRRTTAFTLLEMLIVLVIIALLSAIAWPVFSLSRENGRRAACAANLGQIAQAALQYVQDYDEHLAPLGTSSTQRVVWPQLLFPYARNTNLFKCPDDSSDSTPLWASSPSPSGSVEPFHTSYLMNVGVEAQPGQGIANASIQSPIESIYLCEGGTLSTTVAPYISSPISLKSAAWVLDSPANPLTGDPTDATYGGPSARHAETCVVAYADGHVKALTPTRWYYPGSNALAMTG